jgi:hypothetical protein
LTKQAKSSIINGVPIMDQKALSHLDPKARETYDRVMGTAANMESPQTPTTGMTDPASAPAPVPDSGFVPLTPPDSSAGLSAPISQPAPQPIDPGFNSGPADLSMAGITPSQNDQIPPAPSIFSANPVIPDAQNNSSSFFTNPSPNGTDPSAPSSAISALPSSFDAPAPDTSFATDSPSPMTPITPYTPAAINEVPQAGVLDQTAVQQPMQPPAAVNQAAPHQSSAVLKVLYIVAAVVFFAIYTIFWIKVFNLPFLF